MGRHGWRSRRARLCGPRTPRAFLECQQLVSRGAVRVCHVPQSVIDKSPESGSGASEFEAPVGVSKLLFGGSGNQKGYLVESSIFLRRGVFRAVKTVLPVARADAESDLAETRGGGLMTKGAGQHQKE